MPLESTQSTIDREIEKNDHSVETGNQLAEKPSEPLKPPSIISGTPLRQVEEENASDGNVEQKSVSQKADTTAAAPLVKKQNTDVAQNDVSKKCFTSPSGKKL